MRAERERERKGGSRARRKEAHLKLFKLENVLDELELVAPVDDREDARVRERLRAGRCAQREEEPVVPAARHLPHREVVRVERVAAPRARRVRRRVASVQDRGAFSRAEARLDDRHDLERDVGLDRIVEVAAARSEAARRGGVVRHFLAQRRARALHFFLDELDDLLAHAVYADLTELRHRFDRECRAVLEVEKLLANHLLILLDVARDERFRCDKASTDPTHNTRRLLRRVGCHFELLDITRHTTGVLTSLSRQEAGRISRTSKLRHKSTGRTIS